MDTPEVKRSDILDVIEGESNLYELRLDNTPNNPRVLLCAVVGKRFVLLHAFKKKGRKTPKREITVGVKRKKQVEEQVNKQQAARAKTKTKRGKK